MIGIPQSILHSALIAGFSFATVSGCIQANQADVKTGKQSNPAAGQLWQAPQTNPSNSANERQSQTAQPVPGKIVNGKPDGLFYMQKYWMATRYLEKSCWYFAPDGKFYENLTSGCSPQELAAHKGPQGTYQLNGNKLQATWSTGTQSEAELEIVDGGFNWDTGMFLPVKPIDAEQKMIGSYEGGNSIGGDGNSVIVSKAIRFDADGTFTMSGISSLKSTSEGTQASAGSQSEGAGRWKLDGFLLSLTKSDGTSTTYIAIPLFDEADATQIQRLFIGGTVYNRK